MLALADIETAGRPNRHRRTGRRGGMRICGDTRSYAIGGCQWGPAHNRRGLLRRAGLLGRCRICVSRRMRRRRVVSGSSRRLLGKRTKCRHSQKGECGSPGSPFLEHCVLCEPAENPPAKSLFAVREQRTYSGRVGCAEHAATWSIVRWPHPTGQGHRVTTRKKQLPAEHFGSTLAFRGAPGLFFTSWGRYPSSRRPNPSCREAGPSSAWLDRCCPGSSGH